MAKILKLRFDNTLLTQVFRRDSLSSTLITSATVIVDERKSKIRLPLRLRTHCVDCTSTSLNRGKCIHEFICLRYNGNNDADSNQMDSDQRVLSNYEQYIDHANEILDDEPN